MATRPPLSSFVGTTTPTTRPPLSSFVKPVVAEVKPQPSLTDSGVGSVPVLKQVTQFGSGLGSEIGKAGVGIGQTFLKGIGALADVMSPGASAPLKPVQDSLESIKQNVYKKPFEKETDSLSGKAGQAAGIAAPFVAGTPAITKGQQFLQTLTKTDKLLGSTKVVPYLVQKFAQLAPEMTVSGATEYAVSGGDAKKAKTAAITAGVFSGITHVGSDLYRKIIPQDLKTNVVKSIGGLKGKMGLKDIATNKKINDAVDAYTTISNYAPDIKVIGEDGIEKVFDPTKANFVEMPQALYQTKKKIYEEYSKAAAESGAKFTAKDFYSVIDDLEKYNGKGFTPAYSAKAKQVIDSLRRYLTKNARGGQYFPETDLLAIQDLIENINVDVNPLSDKAGSKVAIEASNKLREILDDKILNASGAKYQQLRTAYSQLKTIENDVINAFKRTTRGSKLSDVIDGLVSVDGLQGLLTQSPDLTFRAALMKSVKSGFQYLRDPEVAMRRAFEIINKGEGLKTQTAQRFFTGSALKK